MREKDETEFHDKLREFEGEENVGTKKWGKMTVSFETIPNYAGGKGCPDEILVVKLKFALLGTDVELSCPVLLELEKCGRSGAQRDIEMFSERTLLGEQISYLEIPMIVIGGDYDKPQRSQEKPIMARINATQVPKRRLK